MVNPRPISQVPFTDVCAQELSMIPGVLARWADEGDGHYQQDRSSEPDDESTEVTNL